MLDVPPRWQWETSNLQPPTSDIQCAPKQDCRMFMTAPRVSRGVSLSPTVACIDCWNSCPVNIRPTRSGGAPVADPARTTDSGPSPGRRPALLPSGLAECIPCPRAVFPKLKCLVTDLEPVPARPCLKFATSYPQVTSQPLAVTSAPYPLKSLTVSSPYPHRSTSNRLLEVLRCGYGEDTVTLGRRQAQDRKRRRWTRLPQSVGAQTSNSRRNCGFHSAGAGNGAAARTPHSAGRRQAATTTVWLRIRHRIYVQAYLGRSGGVSRQNAGAPASPGRLCQQACRTRPGGVQEATES